MGLRYPAHVHGCCFFVTSTFRDWRKLGAVPGFYEALADSVRYYARKYQVEIVGYVLMPTHIHLIVMVAEEKLSGFMRDLKKYLAQQVARELKLPPGGVWMPRYDRVEIKDTELLRLKLKHIHLNPVKDGLTEKPENWIWSSAADYILDKKGLIPIFKDWI